MSHARVIWLIMVLALMAAGCSGTDAVDRESADADGTDAVEEAIAEEEADPDAEEIDVEPAEAGSWTYLVYSMADTNLEQPMLEDVVEMAGVGSGEGVNIVALVDRAEGETDAELGELGDWTSAKLLHVLPEGFEELGDLGEIDMADPAELASFIEFGMTNFPADNYALTVSDHGGGWTGMGPDDSTGEVMDLAEIGTALQDGLAAAGVEKIDLLGFDACLMATYEVANALAPYADYLLASEELEPGHGWDYGVLSTLLEDPSTDAATLGTAFVDGFAGQAEEQQTGAEITLSLMDLTQIPALDEAMATFAGQLSEQVEAVGPLVGRQRADGVAYGRSPDPAYDSFLTDLGVFVAGIGVESLQFSDAADAVLRAINDTVVHQTVGPARLGSTGMSIYFPATIDYFRTDYELTTQVDPWLQFLFAYHGAGQAIPEEAQPAVATGEDGEVIDGGEALVEFVEGGVDVSVQLDPAALEVVESASLSFGYIDSEDGAIVQLGDTAADIAEDGTISGFTDLTVLTISDGEDTIDAYLSLEFDEDQGLAYAIVPLDYTDESGESESVDLSIVFDAETGDVLQEIYYLIDEDSLVYGELVADPTALISPVVLVYGEDFAEWQGYGDTALFADLPALQYDLAELETGTEIYVDITVTDFGGNELIASSTFILE